MTSYVAVGPQVWGRAPEEKAAVAEMKKYNGGRLPKKFIVLRYDWDPEEVRDGSAGQPYVDSFGSVRYHGEETEIRRVG